MPLADQKPAFLVLNSRLPSPALPAALCPSGGDLPAPLITKPVPRLSPLSLEFVLHCHPLGTPGRFLLPLNQTQIPAPLESFGQRLLGLSGHQNPLGLDTQNAVPTPDFLIQRVWGGD